MFFAGTIQIVSSTMMTLKKEPHLFLSLFILTKDNIPEYLVYYNSNTFTIIVNKETCGIAKFILFKNPGKRLKNSRLIQPGYAGFESNRNSQKDGVEHDLNVSIYQHARGDGLSR